MCEQIWRESKQSQRKNPRGVAVHRACPKKDDEPAQRCQESHRNASPKQQTIGILCVEEAISENVLLRICPFRPAQVEMRFEYKQRKRCNKLRQGWMFGIQP